MMNRKMAEELRAQYLAGLIGRATASLVTAARTATDSFAHWYARRAAVRQLRTLDNRILQDIGVCRGDIYTVADETHTGSGKRIY